MDWIYELEWTILILRVDKGRAVCAALVGKSKMVRELTRRNGERGPVRSLRTATFRVMDAGRGRARRPHEGSSRPPCGALGGDKAEKTRDPLVSARYLRGGRAAAGI